MWCHAWVQQITVELSRLSAQEDGEILPPLSPGRGARKLSGAREISPPGWTILGVGATWPISPTKPMRNPLCTARRRWSRHMGDEEYILLLLYAAESDYHPIHAIQLDVDRFAWGTLRHRSQYHPSDTGCSGVHSSGMDPVSPRISYRPCGPRVDGMELDHHGLRHLWNGGIGLRPCHGHEHSWRER
jgi:hypothetical protein